MKNIPRKTGPKVQIPNTSVPAEEALKTLNNIVDSVFSYMSELQRTRQIEIIAILESERLSKELEEYRMFTTISMTELMNERMELEYRGKLIDEHIARSKQLRVHMDSIMNELRAKSYNDLHLLGLLIHLIKAMDQFPAHFERI